MIDWHSAWAYIYDNRLPISATATLVLTAAVKVMPTPDRKWLSIQTAKEFLFDFSHQYLNITNSRVKAEQPPPKS